MKAVTWQGFRDISVAEVADPVIKEPNDAIIKVTSTNICGSDLHLCETMGAFMSVGDVLGHEAIGIVLEVGRDITQIRPGDRVVVPFQISCGHCWTCERRLYTQCEDPGMRHSPVATRRCCGGVRDVPTQGRRRGQDHAQAVVMIQP
jgi:threonine dehydrogenase-like Zn-dependent dehydrogenase